MTIKLRSLFGWCAGAAVGVAATAGGSSAQTSAPAAYPVAGGPVVGSPGMGTYAGTPGSYSAGQLQGQGGWGAPSGGLSCSSCGASGGCAGCGSGVDQGPVGKGHCTACGLRIYPRFDKRYIRQFCNPTINPGSCFGRYKTQWTPWGAACPNWDGDGYTDAAGNFSPIRAAGSTAAPVPGGTTAAPSTAPANPASPAPAPARPADPDSIPLKEPKKVSPSPAPATNPEGNKDASPPQPKTLPPATPAAPVKDQGLTLPPLPDAPPIAPVPEAGKLSTSAAKF